LPVIGGSSHAPANAPSRPAALAERPATKEPVEVSPQNDQELRKLALVQVKKKRDFANHAITYVIVNALLLVIWALTGAGFFWPGFAIAGWGIGLALNAWDVYGRKPISEDAIQRETERLRAEGADR
jgi:hypothetical protein